MHLLVHKRDVFHHLFDASVTSLNFILWFFSVEVFHIFCCVYPWVFGGFFFYAIINDITLRILFLFIGCWDIEVNTFLHKNDKIKALPFAAPIDLMYLGIEHHQLLTSQKRQAEIMHS